MGPCSLGSRNVCQPLRRFRGGPVRLVAADSSV